MTLTFASGSAVGQSIATRLGRPAPAARSVTFVVRNLRNDSGRVMGALFDRPERWVREGEEIAACRTGIRGRQARCTMQVPPGRYAFAFAHDEDGDGQFDRDFLGIPSEGYGFSNDVRPSLSLPSWQSAAFQVPQTPSGAEIVVNARYGI
ncbi:MAG: DUF2141 domain-containing protein [Myxococcota bacterium]|nr:DUF2141 domain-containing protein [Myxococcota bacterium]